VNFIFLFVFFLFCCYSLPLNAFNVVKHFNKIYCIELYCY
jgi:hypothetical protein